MGLSLIKFFGGLREKFFYFSARVRIGRSRSSKVIDFGTNRTRVCDFLLVRYSDFDLISHHLKDIAGFLLTNPPVLHPNFGGVPVGPDHPCWGQSGQVPLANQP